MWRLNANKVLRLSNSVSVFAGRINCQALPLNHMIIGPISLKSFSLKTKELRGLATLPIKIKAKSKNQRPQVKKKADVYSHTLQLPKSDVPFMEPASSYELAFVKSNYSQSLYDHQRSKRFNSKQGTFILLDGPPYANGPLHIGHAINKILKDVFVRHHYVIGQQVLFRPGWDCHGLPIELKALQNRECFEKSSEYVRTQAQRFAIQALDQQAASFTRFNLMADLANPYVTCSIDFVISELTALFRMYSKGLIFKRRLPIYWSPSSRTALAESELEYNADHRGHSAYVGFPLDMSSDIALKRRLPDSKCDGSAIQAIIWTTTPWTLAANQAIAYSPNLNYSLVRISNRPDQLYLISSRSIELLSKQLQCTVKTVYEFDGKQLHCLNYVNPLSQDRLSFVKSDFIETGKGTGLVHMAPNHGQDDFVVCHQNAIEPAPGLVNELGCYNENVRSILSDEAVGLPVIDQGSDYVIRRLQDHVLDCREYVHNYPYDWRTKQPVITMATCQFFIDIKPIKEKCLQSIDQINFIPNIFAHKLKQNINQRPQWCISRQRCWGVPIPAIYHKDDLEQSNPIITLELLNSIISRIKTGGTNCWWTLPIDAFLTNDILLKANLVGSIHDYVKGTDILDVWFDSGVAFNYVLDGKQADLVIEGQDQLRGWFLSSLICSVAINDRPPFKNIFVHGFAVDKEFKKMSKSLGNVLDPNDVVDGCIGLGADVLRLWVATYANSHVNVATREDQFEKCNEMLQKIRRTIRFCLSNLYDCDRSLLESITVDQLSEIDRYYLHSLYQYSKEVTHDYNTYDLKSVISESFNLIEKVSSEYFSSVKDTLYNEPADCSSRRNVQFVLWHIRRILHRHLWPICPMLFDRLTEFDPIDSTAASQIESIPDPSWEDSKLAEQFDFLYRLREQLHSAFNGESVSIRQEVILSARDSNARKAIEHWISRGNVMTNYWNVASVSVASNEVDLFECDNTKHIVLVYNDFDIDAYVRTSCKSRCKRCRKFDCESNRTICARCHRVLADHYPETLTNL